MFLTRPRRALATSATAALTLGALLLAPIAPAQADATTDPAARAAAVWIAKDLQAHGNVAPGFNGADWGLTIDAIIALASAGVAKDIADEAVRQVAESGMGYIQYGGIGSRAKLALALQIGGLDPTAFQTPAGPVDLIAEIRGSIQPNGRFGAGSMAANHFGQSLAMLVLARTPQGVPAAASDYLLTLQCTTPGHANEGGFSFAAGANTCKNVDGDATGMELSALLAAGYDADDLPVQKAVTWLQTRQFTDGSFAPQHATTTGNGNSTGLAGQAARQVGTPAAVAIADRAAAFVTSTQVTCASPFVEGAQDPGTGGGFIRSWRGALAYSTASYNAAVTGGIKTFQVDQWRRNATQAILTLGNGPGFSELTLTGAQTGIPTLPGCPLTMTPPVVSGTGAVGSTLAAVPGNHTPAVDGLVQTWRWLRDGRPIAGATSDNYVVQPVDAAKVLTAEVTATDPTGEFSATTTTSSGLTVPGLPGARFGITSSTRPVARGASTPVSASGLMAGETYTITLSGVPVGRGVASAAGKVVTTVKVPATFGTDRGRQLRVTGGTAGRFGESRLATAGPGRLKASVGKRTVRRNAVQTVRVRGLLPWEQVTVRIAGTPTVTAYASATGTYLHRFKAPGRKGAKRVLVTGIDRSRTGTVTFKVRR